MSSSRLAVLAFSFLLSACGGTEPGSGDDATGGAVTGGTAGSSVTGGTPSGGSAGSSPQGGAAGSATGGTAGVATGGVAGSATGGGAGAATGGQAGLAGGGAAGQAGTGGSAGESGSGGSAGLAGGAAGASGGGAGGRAGSGPGGAGGGGAGGGGAGGSGGAAAYNPCPAAPAPCVILPFGDSITDGFNVPGGYRIDLFQRSLTNNKRITFVGSSSNGPTMVGGQPFPRNHEGHSGWTIDSDATHSGISSLVQSAIGRNPNIVLLMIGTNDLNGNVSVSQAPTRLGNLIDAMFMRRADMLVVVAQIVPGRQDSLNSRIMTYNAAIPSIVATRAAAGRHIISVDMYGAFTRDANYKQALLADDLHPSTAGYNRMAETWYAAIGSLLR
jgi:lysophospholipase L1-like esterase